MKIIDLLNKIANGEEVPKKIKYNNNIYYEVGLGCYENYEIEEPTLIYAIGNTGHLNDEIEIIEEDKKIYKLDWVEGNTFNKIQENSYLSRKEIQLLDSNFKEIGNKINEIIDKLNELKGEDNGSNN